MPMIQTERYEVDPRPIGRGGFGEVYVATDLLFDRKVVIKTIRAPQFYGIDESVIRKHFFREALICARLGQKTEYIVKVLDYGYDRESELPFFVMEFVQGYDLLKYVGKFSWEDAIKLLDHLLRALAFAHGVGVIHSDISPDNILFDEITGIYKLNDFGLAKLLNSVLMRRGSGLSLIGGKQVYLPILEWQNEKRSTHSDLYGLAVTITYLLTSKLPKWEGRGGNLSLPSVFQLFDQAFRTNDADSVFFNRVSNDPVDCTIFGVSPRTSNDAWTYKGGAFDYAIEVTRRDIVQLLHQIVAGEIVTVDSAMQSFQDQIFERVSLKEAAYREKRTVANARKRGADSQRMDEPPAEASS